MQGGDGVSSALAERGFDPLDRDTMTELHDQGHDIADDPDVDSPELAALLAEVLIDDIEPLQDLVDVLPDGDTVDVLPVEEIHGSRARTPKSAWYDVRFQLIHEGDDPATSTTVLQAAFHHVDAVHRGCTLAEVEIDIKRALSRYAPSCGAPAPNNPRCRYPPSYYLCKVICDVGDLSEAEVHLCSNPSCPHMTVFRYMTRSSLQQHVKQCTSASCTLCWCPCGGSRMTRDGPASTPRPCSPCFFFRDVFHQFFLDHEWFAAASAAVHNRHGNFYANAEGQRILQEFAAAGAQPDEVRVPGNRHALVL